MKKTVIALMSLITMACGNYTPTEAPERTLYEEIYVSRQDDGGYHFTNNGNKEWQIFLEEKNIGKLNNTLELTYNKNERAVFLAVSGFDSLWISERNLSIIGVPNFRDIGGIRTNDNRQIKWGSIYRSDDFSSTEESGWQKLTAMNVKKKIDFRSSQEKKENPDIFEERLNAKEYSLIIDPGNMDKFKDIITDKNTTQEDIDKLLLDMNRLFVKKWAYRYKEYFQLLLETETPLVFHCTAGKDRTGLCSALTLYALGVDMETIYDEYELSNHYRHGNNEKLIKKVAFMGIPTEIMRRVMGVERSWLKAGFDQIIQDYGSIDKYLEVALELSQNDISTLREKYLY